MTQPIQDRGIFDAVELLKDNGFDGLAEAVTVLLNAAMVVERSEYLGAHPYERSDKRRSYANGFKQKTVKTRLGPLPLKVPQTRDCEFYPQSLEKGLRSERALLLSIAEFSSTVTASASPSKPFPFSSSTAPSIDLFSTR